MERPFKYKTGFGYCSRKLAPGKGIRIVGHYIPVDWELTYPEKPDFLIEALVSALTGAGVTENTDLVNCDTESILKKIEQSLHYNRFAIQNADVKIYAIFRPVPQLIEAIKNSLAEQMFIKPEQINVVFYNDNFSDDISEKFITARAAVLLGTK